MPRKTRKTVQNEAWKRPNILTLEEGMVGSPAKSPLLGQQGQGDAAGQQSLAKGVLGDRCPEPVAALRQGLEGRRRGVHAVVAGVLSLKKDSRK